MISDTAWQPAQQNSRLLAALNQAELTRRIHRKTAVKTISYVRQADGAVQFGAAVFTV